MAWGFTTKRDAPALMPPRRLYQVHGTVISEVTHPNAEEPLPEGDGLWTSARNLPIGIRTADCVPVLLAGQTKDGPWVATLHSGWRSTVGGNGSGDAPGILRVCVELFRKLGGSPFELTWALGPSIQKCHFEVGSEVISAARKDRAWSEELQQIGPRGRSHLDLQGLLRRQALDLGMDPNKDGSVNLCTMCESDLLWSYRRNDMHGYQWGWIEIL
jgi:polyphenol oxidase